MKKLSLALFILFISIFSSSIFANTCRTYLKDGFGQIFLIIDRYNSQGLQAACNDATYACHRELRYRQSYGQVPRGHCELAVTGGGRQIGCDYSLISEYNDVLLNYHSRGYDRQGACSKAQALCLNDLRFRQSQGRNLYARCERTQGRGGQMVVRNCQAHRINIYGGFIQAYYGQAKGYMRTGVKRRACERALTLCRQQCWGDQRCVIPRVGGPL